MLCVELVAIAYSLSSELEQDQWLPLLLLHPAESTLQRISAWPANWSQAGPRNRQAIKKEDPVLRSATCLASSRSTSTRCACEHAAPPNGRFRPGKPSFQVGNNSTDVSDAEGEQAKPAPAAAVPAPAGATAAPPARKTGASVPHFTSLKSEKRPRFGGDDADDEEDDEEDADPETRWLRYRSGPTTPNIAETARELRRNLSVSGLAQLANGPDGGIKRKLWRPEGEPTKEPGDWERLAVHVARGGLRAATVSFGLRGTVMLVFALIKFIRTRKFKGNELIQAYFGAANGRFAAMFGLWALLYKLTANSLRLLQPPPVPKRRSTLPANYGTSGSYDESGDLSTGSGAVTPHEKGNGARATEEEKAKLKSRLKRTIFMRDPRSRVWHAYVAGAVSALALLVETKDMRISLAQQLFVRGLEGSYNLAQSRGLVNIPHGSVIVFGIACGQIMYAWVVSGESLAF